MKTIVSFLLACSLLSCGNNGQQAPNELWEKARAQAATASTIRYQYHSFWDNRFAKNTYADSATIAYTRLPDTPLGFGFSASNSSRELIFDGQDEWKIDHEKRKIVLTQSSEVAEDTDRYDHNMHLLADPINLPAFVEIDRVRDTIIGGQTFRAFWQEKAKASVSKPDQMVNTDDLYLLDPETALVDRISRISRSGHDTTQIITYYFSDVEQLTTPYEFAANDRAASLGYRVLTGAANEAERLKGLVKAGDQLVRADYHDLNGEEQLLFGQADRKVVLMFGFIGCGGCEYAMNQMKQRQFKLKDGIDLYYSSPVNHAEALKPYLRKKAFPFPAFDLDTRMNDLFHVAAFPTFVMIDGAGKIEKVLGGYDAEVAEILFE